MINLMKIVCAHTDRNCLLLPLPIFLAKSSAYLLRLIPLDILTTDQVEMLKIDNMLSGKQQGLADLGLKATTLESILPTYLHRYRRSRRISALEQP